MSPGEGDSPPYPPHAAQLSPLVPTLPAAPACVATLTVSLQGWWGVKMRWWKPSGEGATQKPPVQSKEHMTSKCQRHMPFPACPRTGPARLCAMSLLAPSATHTTKAKMDSQRHSYIAVGPVGASLRALQPSLALDTSRRETFLRLLPPQLELIAAVQILHVRVSACPGQQGTGSRANTCQQT